MTRLCGSAETHHRFQQMLSETKFKAHWNKASEEERKQMQENVQHEARHAIRLFYLSRKIVQDAKIPVSHKEIQDEAVATLRSFGNQKTDQISKEVYALALSKVLLAKAQDYILDLTQAEKASI